MSDIPYQSQKMDYSFEIDDPLSWDMIHLDSNAKLNYQPSQCQVDQYYQGCLFNNCNQYETSKFIDIKDIYEQKIGHNCVPNYQDQREIYSCRQNRFLDPNQNSSTRQSDFNYTTSQNHGIDNNHIFGSSTETTSQNGYSSQEDFQSYHQQQMYDVQNIDQQEGFSSDKNSENLDYNSRFQSSQNSQIQIPSEFRNQQDFQNSIQNIHDHYSVPQNSYIHDAPESTLIKRPKISISKRIKKAKIFQPEIKLRPIKKQIRQIVKKSQANVNSGSSKKQNQLYKGIFQRICVLCQINCAKFKYQKEAFQTHLVNLLLIHMNRIKRTAQINPEYKKFYSEYTQNSVFKQLIQTFMEGNKSQFIWQVKYELQYCQNPLNVENIFTDPSVNKAAEKLYQLLSK